MLDERKLGIRKMLFQILGGARNEIVDADHLAAFADKMVGKVGTDKTGGSRDEHFLGTLHEDLVSPG